MKIIKKRLMQGKMMMSDHVGERMAKRGYTRKDLISCILQGELTETQYYNRRFDFVIEGFDADDSPMVVIVGFGNIKGTMKIITAMPPIADKFKRVI